VNEPVILAPSILAADPGRLADQMKQAARGGAAMWHLDVMDGHFVPNLSFGPHICAGLRRYTELPFDAHLMVDNPSRLIEPFITAGASSVVLHVELGDSVPIPQMLREIKAAGALPTVSLCPQTPPEAVGPYLPLVGRVLLMSVEPGYGGQPLLPGSLERVRALRAIIDRFDPGIQLQLDGGVTPENAGDMIRAGADVLIAGSAVFDAPDIEARCREFISLMKR
jgi:ribulose-phosphate 3-epimerase